MEGRERWGVKILAFHGLVDLREKKKEDVRDSMQILMGSNSGSCILSSTNTKRRIFLYFESNWIVEWNIFYGASTIPYWMKERESVIKVRLK